MKLETLFLRIVVILLGVPVLALCIFLVPEMGKVAAQMLPRFPLANFLVFTIFWGSAVPFYYALYQAFSLLRFIDMGIAFSDRSVIALQRIKYCAVIISILHTLALPFFYLFAELDDAPGVIIVGCIVPFASLVIAVFAAVLQKLLKHAIDIKSENDLTI
jgi:phosphoglycerol transferase MdoB-like AlkP superfamily enzyme